MVYEGYIYKLVCNDTGLTYYGSTKQKVSSRVAGHRKRYKDYLAGKNVTYTTAFEVLEKENYDYLVIEKFENDDLETLKINIRLKERYYIDTNECVNKLCPIRTKKEILQNKKIYYKNNLEEITKLKREKVFCEDCNCWICRDNIARHNKSLCHIINKDVEILE